MSYKISKELFEAVMETSVYKVYTEKNIIESTNWDYEHDTEWHNDNISINDFFFKCKEWAYNQGYDMLSGGLEAGLHSCYIDYSDKRYTLSMKPINHFFADSEQQAVFDACQWILDNKDKR